MTDATGHFQIEPWREWSTYGVEVADPNALVYARDYQPRQISLHEGPIEPPRERLNEHYELKRFSGTVEERLDAMWGGIANRGCMYGKESQKSLFPMLKAMYEEARSLARSDESKARPYSSLVSWRRRRTGDRSEWAGSRIARVDSFITEKPEMKHAPIVAFALLCCVGSSGAACL